MKRELELKYDLERNVKLVSFNKEKLTLVLMKTKPKFYQKFKRKIITLDWRKMDYIFK